MVLPDFPDSPPIAFAMTVTTSAMKFDTVVPAPTMKAIRSQLPAFAWAKTSLGVATCTLMISSRYPRSVPAGAEPRFSHGALPPPAERFSTMTSSK